MTTGKKPRSTNPKSATSKSGTRMHVVSDDDAEEVERNMRSLTRYTEVHASERLSDALEDGYCYSPGLGWLRYDSKLWVEVPEDAVIEQARKLHKRWYSRELIAAIQSGEKQVAALKRLLSRAGVTAIVALCRGQLLVDTERFDADPDLLNTPSGVVDLRTGKSMPHDPSYFMTRITAVPYVRNAKHKDWDAVLHAVRADARDWLRIRVGNALTGHQPDDDCVPFLQGSGENGKSTFLLGITSAMGRYHMQVSDKILLADAKAHTTEMTDLRGLRCATVEELPEGGHLNAVFLKKITGQRITARRMYRDTITFETTHSLFVTTNYTPVVSEVDWGTWRRLPRLVFPYKFVKRGTKKLGPNERQGDPGLRERVADDAEVQTAALAWAVQGAVAWYKAGQVMPQLPKSVQADTDSWRADSDLVFKYWSECLVADADAHVLSTELKDDFNAWLRENGHKEWSVKTFVARFGDHDLTKRHELAGPHPIRRRDGLSRSSRISETGGEAGGDGERVKPSTTYRAWEGVRFSDGE